MERAASTRGALEDRVDLLGAGGEQEAGHRLYVAIDGGAEAGLPRRDRLAGRCGRGPLADGAHGTHALNPGLTANSDRGRRLSAPRTGAGPGADPLFATEPRPGGPMPLVQS